MYALIILCISILLGWQIIRRFQFTLRLNEAVAASAAVGFNVMAWLYFGTALIVGLNIAIPSVTITVLIASVISQKRLVSAAKVIKLPYSTRFRWIGWLIGAALVILFGYLTYLSYQFPAANGSWISNGNVWGDSPLHVGLSNMFAHGNKLDLISPIYKQVPLTYPLISDFYSGILVRTSGSWFIAITIPTFIMLLALMQLVFTFGFRLLKSSFGAWIQLLMLVFSGSLKGAIILTVVLITGGVASYDTKVGTSISNAVNDSYLNFFYSHMLPQRSFLFGMALFIVILLVLLELYRHRNHVTESSHSKRQGAIIAGILFGLMPLIHSPSYLVLVGLHVLSVIMLGIKEKKLPGGWLIFGITGLIFSLPQLIWQFGSSYDSHFGRFIFGWVMNGTASAGDQNWLWFWLSNLGILFLVLLFGWMWLKKNKAINEIWFFYIAAILIFIICNVYAFLPSLWDNMKFFNYAFWFLMITTAGIIVSMRRSKIGIMISIIVMLSLCTMGYYTLVLSGPKLTYELLNKNDAAFGEKLQRELPNNAFIVVGDRHNHPVTMLAARHVLISYGGWYNLYDANWATTYYDRQEIMTGGAMASSLITKYKLTHAIFSDTEVSLNQANLEFYTSRYKAIMHDGEWWVFDLTQPI